jgi:hypothetical protein
LKFALGQLYAFVRLRMVVVLALAVLAAVLRPTLLTRHFSAPERMSLP